MAKRLAATGEIALWQTAGMVSLHDPCPAAIRRSGRVMHRLAVPLVLLVAVAQADPIDDFIRSPGLTGDPVLAARMFAWCSVRYEFGAWLERTVTGPDNAAGWWVDDVRVFVGSACATPPASWPTSVGAPTPTIAPSARSA